MMRIALYFLNLPSYPFFTSLNVNVKVNVKVNALSPHKSVQSYKIFTIYYLSFTFFISFFHFSIFQFFHFSIFY